MKVVFLDRDGVINEFPGVGDYVTSVEKFRFLPRAAEAVALLTKHGYETFVISNQGCVGKGLITPEGLEDVTAKMRAGIKAQGGKLTGVFYCIHESEDDCDCKKPKTALLEKAMHGSDGDISQAYFIGDSKEDMQAGASVGCKTILVLSGRTHREDLPEFPAKPSMITEDIWSAAEWIIEKKS